MKPKIFIGIDPGKNGAIVALSDDWKEPFIIQIPLVGKEIDVPELTKRLAQFNVHDEYHLFCVIEDVHSIYGVSAKSNFQFGRALEMVEIAMGLMQIPYVKVTAKKWQAVCFEGVQVVKKSASPEKGRGSLDTKTMAKVAVRRLYPEVDCRKSARCTNDHDGIVDALLIAHYAKLKF